MNDTSKTSLHCGHNEGNIRQRTDGRWEVRLSAGIDYKTGKPRFPFGNGLLCDTQL